MTLSEYLVRRGRKGLIPGAVIVLGSWVFESRIPKSGLWGLLEQGVFPLVIVLYILYSLSARCPRCHVRLGYIDLGGGKQRRVPLPGMDCCTNCGLHRNENIPTV